MDWKEYLIERVNKKGLQKFIQDKLNDNYFEIERIQFGKNIQYHSSKVGVGTLEVKNGKVSNFATAGDKNQQEIAKKLTPFSKEILKLLGK